MGQRSGYAKRKTAFSFRGQGCSLCWTFDVERDEVFLKDNDPVGLLVDDLNGVPIISNLDNSVDIDPPIFSTKGDNINTWINPI